VQKKNGLIGYLTLTCMTALSSAIVICLALSTAIATCVWCCYRRKKELDTLINIMKKG
jgi:hypothetical protein